MHDFRSFSVAASLLLAACARPASDAGTVEPASDLASSISWAGDTLRIMRGQSATADNGRITIAFDSADDSRCPANANCVTAGDAQVSIRIGSGASAVAKTLHLNKDPRRAVVPGYDVNLVDLTPYPGTEPPNARLAQVAVLFVTHNR